MVFHLGLVREFGGNLLSSYGGVDQHSVCCPDFGIYEKLYYACLMTSEITDYCLDYA